MRKVIQTPCAPKAIGTYSQAIQVGQTVYISGQIPLDPDTSLLCDTSIEAEIHQVFQNVSAVVEASGGTFNDLVKLTVYLTDLTNFAKVNEIMAEYMTAPYPARAVIGVSALPRGAHVEMDAILVLA